MHQPPAYGLTSTLAIEVRTAARILLEVGDASAFPTSRHLAAYAGLTPSLDTRLLDPGKAPTRGRDKQLTRAVFPAAFARRPRRLQVADLRRRPA